MPTQIATFRDAFYSGVTTFLNFVPTLVGALVVLAIGWFVAGVLARLVERALAVMKIDAVSERVGVSRFLIGPTGAYKASHGLALLTKWFIRLIFLQAVANLLQMPQVTAILNSILLFIPNLAVALLILVAGAYIAKVVSGTVYQSLGRAGFDKPSVFSAIAQYAILGFAGIAALNQIGIAATLVNTLFIGLVASLALAIGLAFGLGGQSVASELTRTWYERGKSAQGLRSVSGGKDAKPPFSKEG